MTAKQRSWDDYFIPGTEVLRNKFTNATHPFGVTDANMLSTLEDHVTGVRMMALETNPIQGQFDYEHFKAIHRHIFLDVYEWAGEERTAPTSFMSKNGHPYYPAGPSLTAAAETEFTRIKQANFLRDMPRDSFVAELGERWGELNVVHSFREGNTRTQCAFFAQLAQQAGWKVDVGQFAADAPLRQEFIDARFHGPVSGSNAKLVDVLDRALSPLASQPPQMDPAIAAEMLEARRIATLGEGRSTGTTQVRTQTKYKPPAHQEPHKGIER